MCEHALGFRPVKKKSHFVVTKRVIQYASGTFEYGLRHPFNISFMISRHLDAN